MNSDFIDNWFEKEYEKYAIRNQQKALFFKFRQIHGPYEITQENNVETFTDDGHEKVLSWEDKTKFKGERISFKEHEKFFSYKGWKVIKVKNKEDNSVKKSKLTESAICSENIEKGTVLIAYDTYKELTEWEIRYEETDALKENPVYEISIKGQRNSPKGIVIFEEHAKRTSEYFKKDCSYKRGNLEVMKEEYRAGSSITKKTIRKGDDLLKITEIFINGQHENGKQERLRRDEKMIKTWEKDQNFSFEDFQIESSNKTIGKIRLKELESFYEARWILTDNYCLGNFTASRNKNFCEKTWRLNSLGSSEILNFKVNKLTWGVLKEANSSSSMIIEWTNKKPEIYDSINSKLAMRGTVQDDGRGQFFLNKEEITYDIHEEARFLYENLSTLGIYEFHLYDPKFTNHFKAPVIHAENALKNQQEEVYNILDSNSKAISNLLSEQSPFEFLQILSIPSKDIKSPLLLAIPPATEKTNDLLSSLIRYIN